MSKTRYLASLTGAFLLRYQKTIIFGIISGVSLFLFFKIFGIQVLLPKNERIGLVGKYRADNLPLKITKMVTRGLTKIGENGEAEPDLAEKWEIKDDGKTWIFTLKDKIFWQDGKEITAHNLQFNFSDVAIERPDTRTIIFKLPNSFAPFATTVARPIFRKGFLGSGEWTVKKVRIIGQAIQKITLVNQKKEKRTYYFYPTEERAKLAFKLGQLTSLEGIFSSEPFDKWPTTTVSKNVDTQKYAAIIFNTDKNKIAADKSFRQALAYATNKENFLGTRALSPVAPTSWAYNPQVKPYNYDLIRAKELIGNLPKEKGQNLNIKLNTSPVLITEAEKIASDWQAIGVKTEIGAVIDVNNDFEALLAIFDIPDDPDQYTFWHSSQTNTNLANYQNPRIDKLLEDGRTEISLTERKKIYLDFQRFLLEDCPAIFLYHPITYTIIRK